VSGKVEVNGTINEVFSLYREHAGVLLPVAFWLFLAVAIVEGLAGDDGGLLLLSFLLAMIAGVVYEGMVATLVRDVRDGKRDLGAGDLARSVAPVAVPLVGAGLLALIGMSFGFVLLIVPGLYLLTIWAVIAPVVVLERTGAIEAFGRSRDLVRGNGWPVFAAVLVASVMAVLGSLLVVVVAEALAAGAIVEVVFSALASTITAPIWSLVAAVLYFRLRAVEEAAASAAPAAPAEPAASA
jgi:hypothetical protein